MKDTYDSFLEIAKGYGLDVDCKHRGDRNLFTALMVLLDQINSERPFPNGAMKDWVAYVLDLTQDYGLDEGELISLIEDLEDVENQISDIRSRIAL